MDAAEQAYGNLLQEKSELRQFGTFHWTYLSVNKNRNEHISDMLQFSIPTLVIFKICLDGKLQKRIDK